MKIYKRLLICVLFLSASGCGDSRPDAAGAAHIYNGTDMSATVLVKPAGAGGAEYTIPARSGTFVPLRKADTYAVSVTSPSELSSYRQSVVVTSDNETDTVFDIGGKSSFALVPTYHVPKDISDIQARGEVEQMKKIGKHQKYLLEDPAPIHTLPRGVYYSFGDRVEAISRLTTPGQTVEIRYQLYAIDP